MGRSFKHCPVCGAVLEKRPVQPENKVRRACPSCDFIYYDNPTPAAGVILVENARVLLVERKFEPRAGLWTLPAGFVEKGEHVADCAVREAHEETNLTVEVDRLFDVYSAFDDPRAAVVLILYLVKRVQGKLKCGDDASDARFFPLDGLPDEIAFSAHRRALADIVARADAGLL
jgi:ADP-ribose pyrophosphatase YjhB (NUDIX family)